MGREIPFMFDQRHCLLKSGGSAWFAAAELEQTKVLETGIADASPLGRAAHVVVKCNKHCFVDLSGGHHNGIGRASLYNFVEWNHDVIVLGEDLTNGYRDTLVQQDLQLGTGCAQAALP